MIKLTNVSLMRGRKVLLEEASAQVFPGHKVALIGSNGCGKSSLFALLRHELTLDAGDCTIPADWKIVSVAQETPSTDRKAIDYVIDGDKHLRQLQHLLAQAERAEDGVAIARSRLTGACAQGSKACRRPGLGRLSHQLDADRHCTIARRQ